MDYDSSLHGSVNFDLLLCPNHYPVINRICVGNVVYTYLGAKFLFSSALIRHYFTARLDCTYLCAFFSERELTFTFAICYRPSVCRLSVVCNVRAPYSGGSNFRQYFYGIWYPSHPLTSTENFTEMVPGEPLRQGS